MHTYQVKSTVSPILLTLSTLSTPCCVSLWRAVDRVHTMRFNSSLLFLWLAKSWEVSAYKSIMLQLRRTMKSRGGNGNKIENPSSSSLPISTSLSALSSPSKPSGDTSEKEVFGFWKQSINLPALRKLGRVFIDPTILRPTFEVDSLEDLDFEALKNERNISAIIYGHLSHGVFFTPFSLIPLYFIFFFHERR